MRRTIVLAAIACAIGISLLSGCGSTDPDPRTESGLVGAWSGGGGSRIVYKDDGTVADLAIGATPSSGTYSVERSGRQWVEIYTDPTGKTTRHFFTISANKLRFYFNDTAAKSGDLPAVTYLRVQ